MMIKTFNYNGVNSATVGLYIMTCNTYDSAGRDIEFVSVPGASGDYVIDNNRYNNITIAYTVMMLPKEGKTTIQQIRDIKKFLYQSGNYTYKVLSDEYYQGYYRYGVFSGPAEWEIKLQKYGQATLEFNCRPQLYEAASSELLRIEDITYSTQTKTVTKQYNDNKKVGVSLIALFFDTSETQAIGTLKIQSYYNPQNEITLAFTTDEPLYLPSNKVLYINPKTREIYTTDSSEDPRYFNRHITAIKGTWLSDIGYFYTGSQTNQYRIQIGVKNQITTTGGTGINISLAAFSIERWEDC